MRVEPEPPPGARLPFASLRRADPRPFVAAAFAAGGAAVASLCLMRAVPAWSVAFGAAAPLLYGASFLFARSRTALIAALAGSSAVTFAGIELITAAALDIASKWDDALVLAHLVAVVILIFVIPPARFAVRLRARPAHDTPERVLLAASLWLALVAGGAALSSALFARSSGKGLGHGGLTWIAEGAALALGAGLAIAALVRDTGRLRFLRALREGSATGWEILPRNEAKETSGELLSYISPLDDDGALVSRSAQGAGPFRETTVATTSAWIPLDPSAAARALRRRLASAALLALGQGAGAVALGAAAAAHGAPLTGAVEVAVGGYHACARLEDGTVRCWGMNREGQLGDGTTDHRYHPVAVEGLREAAQLAAGTLFTCALRTDGSVACWGGSAPRPTPIHALPPARRIAAGGEIACALTRGDEIHCWGSSRPPFPGAPGPRILMGVDVPAEGAIDLAVGDGWGCVRRSEEMRCWGAPDAMPARRANPPRCLDPWWAPRRERPEPAGSLTATWAKVCEAGDDGRVRCWGADEGPHEGASPGCLRGREVPGPTGARRVALLEERTCALDEEGAMRCWDDEGRGGALLLDGVAGLASSQRAACAVRRDGTVWCWGDTNDYGELGDGTRRASAAPVQVRR